MTNQFVLIMKNKQKRLISIVLSKLVNKNKDIKILDIGCGEGFTIKFLQKEGFTNVSGLDIVDFRSYIDFKIYLEDMCVDNLQHNEKYDVITALEVIEHTKNPWNFIENCAKLLKPNGELILSRPNMTNLFSRFYFLFSGEMLRFRPNNTNNMNIISLKIMKMMTAPFFRQISIQGDSTTIPIIRFQLPPTILTSNSLIYHFVRYEDLGTSHIYIPKYLTKEEFSKLKTAKTKT